MKACLVSAVLLSVASLGIAGDAKQNKKVPDDLRPLQGVWGAAAGAKLNVRLMFMDGKIGYNVKDGKTDDLLLFLGLTEGQYEEAKGKRSFKIEVAKDTSYVVSITKLEDDKLTVAIHDRGEFTLQRLNVRASKNSEAKKLLGGWTITDVEARGEKITPKDIGLDEIVFQEDRYFLKAGGKDLLSSFYGVDATQQPKSLNWFGVKADFVIPLIYELNGDELRLCHPILGKDMLPRPTSFDTKGTQTILMRAKRAK